MGDEDDAKVHVLFNRVSTTVDYEHGDTILESARRAGIFAPSRCQRGDCGTCRALIESATAAMRRNNYLNAFRMKDGWVLTCQAIPSSREVHVNYDTRQLVPGLRFLLRAASLHRLSRSRRSLNKGNQSRRKALEG